MTVTHELEVKPATALLRIAIDGPAGAGKSTVARQVADALGYTYVDTGAMYRALAWAVLDAGIDPEDETLVSALAERLDIHLEPGKVLADGKDITSPIRTPEISRLTSAISALPRVRTRMAMLQKEMGRRGGVVMEGRDIGTVVLPEAEVKVFLTASLAERARRRQEELAERGTQISMQTLLADIAVRDARDGSREVAPMVPAADAILLDSDTLTVEEVTIRIITLLREAERRHAR